MRLIKTEVIIRNGFFKFSSALNLQCCTKVHVHDSTVSVLRLRRPFKDSRLLSLHILSIAADTLKFSVQ